MSCSSWPWTLLSAYLAFELFSRGALLRGLLREVARFFVFLEVSATRLMQLIVRPRFQLTGDCQRCGACCRQILADPPAFIKRSSLLSLFLAYHRLAHRFTPVARGPQEEIIFACGHLFEGGHCGIYRHRPLLCRNYPVVPFFDPPRPLPICSFGVAPRVLSQMDASQRLPLVNTDVAVHHPTPTDRDEVMADHFHLVHSACSRRPPADEEGCPDLGVASCPCQDEP